MLGPQLVHLRGSCGPQRVRSGAPRFGLVGYRAELQRAKMDSLQARRPRRTRIQFEPDYRGGPLHLVVSTYALRGGPGARTSASIRAWERAGFGPL